MTTQEVSRTLSVRTELTPLVFLERTARMFPDRIAVTHGPREITNASLRDRALRLAAGLLARGIEPGDRVAFLAPNIPAMVEAHFGVPAARAVLVALNTRLSPDELTAILTHSGSRLIFVDKSLRHLVEHALPEHEVVTIDDSGLESDPYERFLSEHQPLREPQLPEDEDSPIALNYTSGTTGAPKGVVYTHRGAALSALGAIVEVELTTDTSFLWTLPMFHCNGWCFVWAVTAVGGRHVCLRRVDADEIWATLENDEITHLNGAPTVHIALASAPAAHRLARPVTATVAGAPPSPALLARLRELGFRPKHVYGLTETYGPITSSGPYASWAQDDSEYATLLARQGQSYVSSELVRVVDPELNDVPRDGRTLGEVVMRGNMVMAGYFNDDDATAKAFEGGWFHSGDLAVMHQDSTIEVRDRKKDIIISGGENISTIEVEAVICSHQSVLEAAVVGMPHPHWGERPAAFVDLKYDGDVTEQELIEHCRGKLAHFKCPDRIEFGELPKTSTGKVRKAELRQRVRTDDAADAVTQPTG